MRYQRFQVTYVLDIRDFYQRFQVIYHVSEISGYTPYIRNFMIHIRYQRFQVTYKISEISVNL